jgi:Na+/melibiose symporter-like transporter
LINNHLGAYIFMYVTSSVTSSVHFFFTAMFNEYGATYGWILTLVLLGTAALSLLYAASAKEKVTYRHQVKCCSFLYAF